MTGDTGARARQFAGAAASALKERVAEVDRLNVFPVPDGDTGTNMSLTMDALLSELDGLAANAGLREVCGAIAHGSLMGARGNSGVILSQVLRGMCDTLGKGDAIDTAALAAALANAQSVAYQAVRKPVEGTMLTVVKDCAGAAKVALDLGLALDAALERVADAAYDSVRRGPDLLPVLKENGVVDAGGYGLAILVEGLVASLEGESMHRADSLAVDTSSMTVEVVDDWDDEEYLYCAEFLIHGESLDRDAVHEAVAARGGSELVVGSGDLLKVHVHTDQPGAVLEFATCLGEVSEVHVNNMRRQTAERTAGIQAERPAAKPIGVVAVAAGEGLRAILESLGVDVVVSGGQTMNPSTKELVEACSKVDADAVVILPNNRNIIMAAQQVDSVCDKRVAVVPTTSVPQSFAAMLEFDSEGDLEEIARSMQEAASRVRTGEVTTAVKDASGKAGPIREGQVIGISDREIEVVGDDLVEVAVSLALIVADGGAETLTLLAGAEMVDETLEEIAERVREARGDLEVETGRGEQPLYPLLLSAE